MEENAPKQAHSRSKLKNRKKYRIDYIMFNYNSKKDVRINKRTMEETAQK